MWAWLDSESYRIERSLEKFLDECNRTLNLSLAVGRNVLDDNDPKVANFLLCPPVEWGCLPSGEETRFEKAVTILWIQHCKDIQKIVDPHTDPLFKPLPAVKDSQIFSGLIFGIIGIANSFVKEVFTSLLTLFDGRVEASLVVTPKNGILPCTHLIVESEHRKVRECKRKLTASKVIDPSWVLECIINDKLLSEDNFPFKRSFRPSMPFRAADADTHSSPLRIKPRLQLQGITQALNDIASPNEIGQSLDSSSLNISKIGRIIGAAASKTAQPDVFTPNGRKRPSYDLPFDGHEETNLHPPPIKRTSIKTESPVPKVEPTFVSCEAKPRVNGFSSQLSNLAASSHRLALQQLQQGGNNFPYVEPDNHVDSVISTAVSENLLFSKKNWEVPPVIAPKPRPLRLPVVEWKTESVTLLTRIYLEQWIALQLQKRLTAIMTTFRYARLDNTVDVASGSNDELDIIIANDSNRDRQERPPVYHPVIESVQPVTQIASTSGRKSDRQGPLVTEPVMPCVVTAMEADSFIPMDPMSALASSQLYSQEIAEAKKVFLFTSVGSEIKNQLISDIESLGGEVSNDDQGIPDNVTHLLCGKLVRGTKLMGCLASARWILPLKYLEESVKAGKWLQEQAFEWIEHTENMDERQLQIARPGRRWREKLAGIPTSDRGAFYGYRVILFASQEKANGLIPLLIAGKAAVIIRSQLNTTMLAWKPTHAVIAKPKENEWNKQEMRALADIGVKAYQLEYLAKYLLEENFDEKSCLNPEFVNFLSRVGK